MCRMNKILPFAFVFTFWGLFYLGTKNPEQGETIALVAVASLVSILLYNLRSCLIKKINKKA